MATAASDFGRDVGRHRSRLALVENDLGPELAKSGTRKLFVYHRRGGGQRSSPRSSS
jgi:transcriptional regulator GlxA family with amidase domain